MLFLIHILLVAICLSVRSNASYSTDNQRISHHESFKTFSTTILASAVGNFRTISSEGGNPGKQAESNNADKEKKAELSEEKRRPPPAPADLPVKRGGKECEESISGSVMMASGATIM